MKLNNNFFIPIITMLSMVTYAQDDNNKWALSLGINAIDFRTSAGGGKNWVDNHFSQLFLIKKNWNTSPSVTINVSKYLDYNISVGLGFSANKIEKYAYNPENTQTITNRVSYYNIDLNTSYSFMSLIHSRKIEPQYNIGISYIRFGNQNYQTIDNGLGLKYWFYKNIGLTFSGTYKWSAFSNTNENKNLSLRSHIQWMFTLIYKFGAKDTDKDGVYDKLDACPEVAGLKQYQGCPDSDGDSIIDKNDDCPNIAGLIAFNGCPDTDGDGIPDKDDLCPEIFGKITLNGCPDSDGDGIMDKDDNCYLIFGPIENKGCPWPDTDLDGVLDKDDKCPDEIGTIANNGCPEVPKIVVENLNEYSKTIFFNYRKSTFKSQTLLVLQSITQILEQYPTHSFSVESFSDEMSNSEDNIQLSKKRASAVRKYFIYNGIAPERLTFEGYENTQSIGTDLDKNRVEIKLIK